MDPDGFVRELSMMLRFRRSNKQAGKFLSIHTGSTSILTSPQERCFDAVTEEEIVSSLYYVKTQPGQKFRFTFWILDLFESSIRPILGRDAEYGSIVSGEVMWDGRSFECGIGSQTYIISEPESFVDRIIASLYPNVNAVPQLVCFIPSFSMIKLFIANRCPTIPNFHSIYMERLLDVMLNMIDRYPKIVAGILRLYTEESYTDPRETIESIRSQEVKPQID